MSEQRSNTASLKTYQPLFDEFLSGADTLQVYHSETMLFSSDKDQLLPLLEYIEGFVPEHEHVVIFDKVMGNAAALLSIKARCQEVYSPLGSQLAVATLEKHGISYHLAEIIPCIQKPDGREMCPMEELSISKDPEEFYEIMRNRPR